MRAQLKQAHMAYKRKTFPKMSDVISFDALVEGDGLAIKVFLAQHLRRLLRNNIDCVNQTVARENRSPSSTFRCNLMKDVSAT